ncbi:MAG: hypothetical protein C4332_03625 [Meiothermus sp.]
MQNLPKYLPTTHSAQPQGQDRVQVQGEARGHKYTADGLFHRDQGQNRLDWGSDGEMRYRGWLQVEPDGDGSSRVTVHLSFDPPQEMAQQMQNPDQKIQEGLEKALESIANLVEGKDGKVEPPSAQPTRNQNM